MNFILSVNIGQTNAKATVVDLKGNVIGTSQVQIPYTLPYFGHIEQNPESIYEASMEAIKKVCDRYTKGMARIKAIAIASEKKNVIMWDKKSGNPLWNALLHTDSRSETKVISLLGKSQAIKAKTGLTLTPFEAATKISWILEKKNICDQSEVCYGTPATWLAWRISNGSIFAMDSTSAAATLLYNIHEHTWDKELLSIFGIDNALLPEVKTNSELYGYTDKKIFGEKIPIYSMIASSQSAMLAAGCFRKHSCHALLGSSSTIQIHTEEQIIEADHLNSTIALDLGEKKTFCVESSMYSTGFIVKWLETHMGIIRSAKEIESLANSVPDSGGVYFVPTMTGISYPKHNSKVRGAIFGLSENTNIGHVSKGLLEGIALVFHDLLHLISEQMNISFSEVKCSGGVSENILLLEMISRLSDITFCRSTSTDLSSIGAALLAGLALDCFEDLDAISSTFTFQDKIEGSISEENKKKILKNWKKALEGARKFTD